MVIKSSKNKRNVLIENLKGLRKKHNLTQKDLARKSGVAYATLTKIEIWVIKEPSVYICSDLARALEVSIEDLIIET